MTEDEIVEAMAKAIAEANDDELATSWADYHRLARAALAIAIPWAREQGLREAAECIRHSLGGMYLRDRILALIPSRPSQETTDE